MSAIDYVLARLPREEGTELYPYDDATGLRVRSPTPGSHITWGRGFNLDECGSPELFDVMDRFFLTVLDAQLQKYPWYTAAGAVRASVPLDIAYNGGMHDLLGYPNMIAAFARQDWPAAAAECTDKDPKLDASRYAPLRAIIINGVSPT